MGSWCRPTFCPASFGIGRRRCNPRREGGSCRLPFPPFELQPMVGYHYFSDEVSKLQCISLPLPELVDHKGISNKLIQHYIRNERKCFILFVTAKRY